MATDINNDGRMDLFVANDTVQNFLFLNRGHGKWEEAGVSAEVGFSENGQPRSGMGVDAADFDGDGWEDLFVANIDREMFALYRNQHNETFADVAYDNDGLIDLILANGHPDDMIEKYSSQVKYKEPLLLFHNEKGKLRNLGADAGLPGMLAARGLAVGDYDNDGRLDVLVGVNGGAPVLLHNRAGADNHWLGLKLVGTRANRDAVGARITWSAGGVRRSRLRNAGGSYLSSHDPREVLGLGAAKQVEWVEIRWPAPGNQVDRYTNLPVDRYMEIREK